MSERVEPFSVCFTASPTGMPYVRHVFKGAKRAGLCRTKCPHTSPRQQALQAVALATVRTKIAAAIGVDPERISFDGFYRPHITLADLPTAAEARRLAERVYDLAYTGNDATDIACNGHRPDLWGDGAYRDESGLMRARQVAADPP